MNKRRVETGTPDAVRSGNGLDSVQAYLPWILGGAGVLLVGSVVWGLVSSASEQKAAKAWGDYYFNLSGNDSDTFIDLAEEHPGSAAADWAILTAGAGYLEKGLDSIYVNKADGETQIKLAIEQFKKVVDSGNAQLKAKALMGLAQANESLGNVDEAAGFYEEVSKVATQPRILALASERRSFLASDSGKEFYAWFKKQDPKPDPVIQLPADLQNPPTGPDMEFSEPAEVSPEDLPEVPNLESPTGDAPTVDLPALEPGSAGDSQPVEEPATADTTPEK